MPMFGGCVVRVSDRVLLHHTNAAGASPAATSPAVWGDVISKCGNANFRTSSFTEAGDPPVRLGYHISSDDDYAFALVSDEKTTRRTAHLALDDMMKLFRKMFVESPSRLTGNSCDVFRAPLLQLLTKYSDDAGPADDKVKKVKQTVEEVKSIALDNVERVLQRGQQIDEIITATDDLQAQAQGFQRSSRQLRQQMWWNEMKVKVMMGSGVLVFLLVVYFVFCGGITCSSSKTQ